MRYVKNEPNVISETMGDETIIVDLASGHYYSLRESNVDVWECLERGYDEDEIAGVLSERYGAANSELGESVAAVVAQLRDEGLIVTRDGDTGRAEELPPAVGDPKPLSFPPISKFTDMQDIILLDPVHEVDARGWPHAAAG
jgi:hypothetical protein